MVKRDPFLFQWDGRTMTPRPIHLDRAQKEFDAGQVYRLQAIEERSRKSERHYFAVIREVFKNLPDHYADQIPSPEHLRKFALIRCNYFDLEEIVCASEDDAIKVSRQAKSADEYAITVIRDNVIRIYTAKSQSAAAMGSKAFQKSKDDVLIFLAALIDTPLDDLRQNAGKEI